METIVDLKSKTGIENYSNSSIREAYISEGKAYLKIMGHKGIRVSAIVGSTSYEPRIGDDIDIFIISERDIMWYVFLRALMIRRLGKFKKICLSLLMDEKYAVDYFSNLRDPLIKSDAFHSIVYCGLEFYNDLLQRIPVESEKERRDMFAKGIRNNGKGGLPRIHNYILNSLSMIVVLPPVLLKGMINSKRLKKSGGSFKTVYGWGRFYLDSEKYNRLRERYKNARTP